MWTAETRKTHDRKASRYPSDLLDEEWALVEPHLPPVTRHRKLGHRRHGELGHP